MERSGEASPAGAAADGQPALHLGAGVQVLAASQEWGDDDSSDEDAAPGDNRLLRRASTRQLRLATSTGKVEDLGAARRPQARQAAGQAVLATGSSSSSDDDGKPHLRRRRKFAVTPSTDEVKVQGSANEWAAMEDSSSEDKESPNTIVSARHERYKRLAQELEANQPTVSKVEQPNAISGKLGYICRYAAFSFSFVACVSVDWALLFATLQCDGHWLELFLLAPPCLFLKVMEAALSWTEPAIVQPRRAAWQQGKPTRWLLLVLLTVGLLGGCYVYRLFLAHSRAARHKRTFLLELESLDPSRQLLADDVRWDNDDLLWGPFVVVGLVSRLAHGSCARGPLGVHQALVWAFLLLVVMVSVIVAVVNFDYCASHHIRTEYGMVFDDCRWVKCVRASGRERRSKAAHYVYRVLEVVGRVLVLVVGAMAATRHPLAVLCLALADYLIVARCACHLSRPSAEVLLISIPSFIVDLSWYIDEPGFALPARKLSRTIRAVRRVEFLAAAAVLVWWMSSDADMQLAILRGDRAACAMLLGLLLAVHAAFFATGTLAEVCQPPGDVFTSVIDGDLGKVEWSLSSAASGCTEKTVCAKTRQTALHVAAENGQLECARLLLSKRADPSALDTNRDNVLHIACRRGNLQLAELLLEGGTAGTSDAPRSHARSRSAPACAAGGMGGGGAPGPWEDERQRQAQAERLMSQQNAQAQLPKDVIARRAPPSLLELLGHHEERLKSSGLVSARPDSGQGPKPRADSDVVGRPGRAARAASEPPSITTSLSAPNMDRRTSTRASIFGKVLGGDHFNIQAGPRPQVQASRLDLASFIVQRSMGEQYERLKEIWTLWCTGEDDSAICLSYLRTVSTLGAGGFGRVLKVQDLRNGKFYALKLQKKDKAAKQAVREATAMLATAKLCPFIVEAKRIFHTTGFYGIVMEFCEMDLNVRILQGRGADAEQEPDRDLEPLGLPVDIAGRYTACVMLALEHLHNRSMVFRDLKPENVLITSTKERRDVAKLADFGMARSLQTILSPQTTPSNVGHRLTMKAGTPAFMSAEAMSDETQAPGERGMHWYASRDWYGLGCCVLLMLLAEQGGRKIHHGSRQVLLPAPQEEILSVVMEAMGKDLITEDVFELVTGLTDVRVNYRWNQDELRRSPFLREALQELDPDSSDSESSSSGSAEGDEDVAVDAEPEPFPELQADISLAGVEEAKRHGNEAFSRGSFEESVKWLSKAIWLAEQWRGLKATRDLRSILRSNRAFALLRLERWAEAEADCSKALGFNAKNVKAHYRRAMARLELGMAEGAMQDVDRVLEEMPSRQSNAEAVVEAVDLRRKIREKLGLAPAEE